MTPKRIYIHHSADSSTKPQFEKINTYHRIKFNMISSLGLYGGYNKLIEKDGTIETYRKDGEETTAQKGDNKEALSVCLSGHFDTEYPNKAQVETLQGLLSDWMNKYQITNENVHGHRFIGNTSCPGKNITDLNIRTWANGAGQLTALQKIIDELKKQVEELMRKLGLKK